MDNSSYYWVSHVFVIILIKLLKNEKNERVKHLIHICLFEQHEH